MHPLNSAAPRFFPGLMVHILPFTAPTQSPDSRRVDAGHFECARGEQILIRPLSILEMNLG